MSGSGVSGYAAVNARVRAMYSGRLTAEVWAGLNGAADVKTLIGLLKNSVYGRYLNAVEEKSLSPRRTVFQIENRVADAYAAIVHWVPVHARAFMAQLYRRFEVDNLKAVLRGVATGVSWNRVQFVLFPFGPSTVLPAEKMMESGSVRSAVDKLRGTPYYDTLNHAMERYRAEQNLFPLEVALDLDYWRILWSAVHQLPTRDRMPSIRIAGSMMDVNNLLWAIRYKVYYRLSEEEIINYTLPFGYRVRDEDIRGIAAGADISQTVMRIYPEVTDVEALLEEPRSGLPQLEVLLTRHVAKQCRAAFSGDPFHLGVPLAFILLSEMETQDLTVLIEAKAMGTPAAGFQPYLLMSGGSPDAALS